MGKPRSVCPYCHANLIPGVKTPSNKIVVNLRDKILLIGISIVVSIIAVSFIVSLFSPPTEEFIVRFEDEMNREWSFSEGFAYNNIGVKSIIFSISAILLWVITMVLITKGHSLPNWVNWFLTIFHIVIVCGLILYITSF